MNESGENGLPRLRVSFVVEYEWIGPLPEPGSEDFDLFLVGCLLEHAPNDLRLHWGDDEDELELEPAGWGVHAGGYGDLSTGLSAEGLRLLAAHIGSQGGSDV